MKLKHEHWDIIRAIGIVVLLGLYDFMPVKIGLFSVWHTLIGVLLGCQMFIGCRSLKWPKRFWR